MSEEILEAKAQARFVRVTPQKARRIIDVVRGKSAIDALDLLRFAPQAVAVDVSKVLSSALANAKVKAEKAGKRYDVDSMIIQAAYVDEGPTMKRIRPQSKGRAARVLKRSSHITVVVSEKETAKGRAR